jgi:DNA-directed RNA polymerase subunit RPC12/RpoP
MLSEEAKKKYLEDHGVRCPYCGSDNIDAQDADFLDDMMYQKVECLNCQKEWTDHYKLVDIGESEEDDPQLPESICQDGSIAK